MSKYAKLSWNGTPSQVLARNGLNPKTLLFAATTLKRLYDPFVPFLTSGLSVFVTTSVEGDRGVIHYKSPYAHYIHEGELMVSPSTGSSWAKHGEIKVYAGSKLAYNKSEHPVATANWDKVAKKQILGQYTREVQAFIRRG